MKIAINVWPLHSAHKDRGIGYYTKNLIESLRNHPSLHIQEFLNLEEVEQADLVHYPWFDLFYHTLPLIKKFPTVVTIHDVIPLRFQPHYPRGLKANINLYLQRWALGNVKHILTDSKASKSDILKFLGAKDEKISRVYLAADKDFRILKGAELLRFKRKYSLPDQFMLYVGDANWVKNLPFLIEGFNKIIKVPNLQNFKLVLVGGVFLKKVENINHPELESLKQLNRMIIKSGLEDIVIRPGNISKDDLVGFYNLATIYIQPSFFEGFGLPVLEAFSCGTPVVCSHSGSLPEVGGDAAVYFDPHNLEQFVYILTEVLQNESLLSKLSNLGLKRATNFSWEKFAQETKQVYQRVV